MVFFSDIHRKDEYLHTSAEEHARLREERERLLTETESLTKQADEYNSNVRKELFNRDSALATVNMELGRLRELSEKEMKAKDNDVLVGSWDSHLKLKRVHVPASLLVTNSKIYDNL